MKRINKFAILKIRMEGFKRFKEPFEADMDFLTYVSGGNGQGKTTIADAIAYAFCGTPFWGEKSCDRLINPECKEMKVEIRFVDEDGEIHCLTRRKNGNTTTITLDTVQLRQTDMNAILEFKGNILEQIYLKWSDSDYNHQDNFKDIIKETFNSLEKAGSVCV